MLHLLFCLAVGMRCFMAEKKFNIFDKRSDSLLFEGIATSADKSHSYNKLVSYSARESGIQEVANDFITFKKVNSRNYRS